MANIRLSNIMSPLFGRVPKAVPLFSYTNSVQQLMDMSQPANIDCGALTANTWKTAFTSSDPGVLLAATVMQNNTDNQSIGMRVYFDDVLAGELITTTATTSTRGITTYPGLGNYSVNGAYQSLMPMYPFNSLRIDVQSSVARSAGISILLKVTSYSV